MDKVSLFETASELLFCSSGWSYVLRTEIPDLMMKPCCRLRLLIDGWTAEADFELRLRHYVIILTELSGHVIVLRIATPSRDIGIP